MRYERVQHETRGGAPLATLLAGALVLATAACADTGPTEPDPARGMVEVTATEHPPSPVDDLDSRRAVICDEIRERAIDLVETSRVCGETGGCRLVDLQAQVNDRCLPALQCTAPVGTHVDVEDLVNRARRISAEYLERGCGPCAIATCIPTEELVATCGGGLCDADFADPEAPQLR